jgi:dihydrofolate reductase
MSKVRIGVAVSLDGYMAGMNQRVDNALGDGGESLHEWMFELEAFGRMHGDPDASGITNENTRWVEDMFEGVGAGVMGRNMFGGHPGPWDEPAWEGWWGDEPPYRCPTFVVTHHEREPLVKGDTTFYFVTEGVEAAIERAKEAAGGLDVSMHGGPSTINQALAAGLVDEMIVHIAPVFLGSGERVFTDLGSSLPKLEQVEAVGGPGVAHIRYRVTR